MTALTVTMRYGAHYVCLRADSLEEMQERLGHTSLIQEWMENEKLLDSPVRMLPPEA